MKQIILLITMLGIMVHKADAQNFSEWFRQKQTQKKYLLQQIAALKVYGNYLKKGYQISRQGLDFIGSVKKGDFNMHDVFFKKLQSINGQIGNSPRVKDILDIQQQIRMIIQRSHRLTGQSVELSRQNKNYITQVFEKLNTDCIGTITSLKQVLSYGELEMKDDERLERINLLHGESIRQLGFASSFAHTIIQLIRQREGQRKELQNLHLWHGIKNK